MGLQLLLLMAHVHPAVSHDLLRGRQTVRWTNGQRETKIERTKQLQHSEKHDTLYICMLKLDLVRCRRKKN
jgi:hypothetical protein